MVLTPFIFDKCLHLILKRGLLALKGIMYNVSKQGIRDVSQLNILESLVFFLVAAAKPNGSEQGTEVGGAERGRTIGYHSYITLSLLRRKWKYLYLLSVLYLHLSRGRSQATFTRGGGVGGQKKRLFVNFHTIENVNGGG